MTIRQHAAAAAALALLLAPLALFAQETKKLTDSSVPATVSIADGDYLYVVQGGVSKRGTAGQLRAVTDAHVANDLTIESSATIGTDSCVRIGDRDAATNAVQICRSTADDRLYHDTDADGTKDTGEEFIDQVGGGGASGYSPDNQPSSCAHCDEFEGGAADLTWRDGNVGATNIDYVLGGLRIDAPAVAGENLRVQWTTGADGSATDWVAHAKLTFRTQANYNAAGIALLVAGSEATPTDIQTCSRQYAGGDGRLYFSRFTSYTTFGSDTATDSDAYATGYRGPVWLRMSYVSSTKVLSCALSTDGFMYYTALGTRTLSAHPTTSIGMHVNAANGSTIYDALFHYFRQRTDATGTTDPYPVGE